MTDINFIEKRGRKFFLFSMISDMLGKFSALDKNERVKPVENIRMKEEVFYLEKM